MFMISMAFTLECLYKPTCIFVLGAGALLLRSSGKETEWLECQETYKEPMLAECLDTDRFLPFKFKCNLCNKGFISQSALEMHLNVHTGAKPFRCDVCPAKFNHRSNLQRHLKTVHKTDSQNISSFYKQ